MTAGTLSMGIDVGGTFTDLVLIDQGTGEVSISKVPSTPRAVVDGVVNAIHKSGAVVADIAYFVHGTTVGTNTVIERNGARVGLITTRGMEDILELQRGDRQHHYDLRWHRPVPLVPRRRRVGLTERVDYRGRVIDELREDELPAIIEYLRSEGAEAVAVCLLFSFVNPDHERRLGELLQRDFPEAFLSLSSEIMPEFREYDRTSTVVVDAYIKPRMNAYIGRMQTELARLGLACDVTIMQSNGGVSSAQDCKERPVSTLLSGPAGGVVAGAFFGKMAGFDNVITIDMGGTSCDVSLVSQGAPLYSTEGEIEWGIPVKAPMLEVKTIGAGGGSIAWVDKGGFFKVGPQSAGADPGPVCYGQGGEQPTVTDANLVLGLLNPDYFLGGEMRLDVAKARQAVQEKVAIPLNLDLRMAAQGIVDIANANMVNLMHEISVAKGYDIRDFALVAFGGAGPVHAGVLAEEMGMPFVVVPRYPGVLSAMGLVLGDIRYDFVQSYVRPASLIEQGVVVGHFVAMENQGRLRLERAGYRGAVEVKRFVDMRYARQNYEIQVPVPPEAFENGDTAALIESFHREYAKLYGYYLSDEPFEIVSLRTSVIGRLPKASLVPETSAESSVEAARKGSRTCSFKSGEVECPVYEREQLPLGASLPSPALIEEVDSTIVIYPGQEATVDEHGNVIIKTSQGKRGE
ncbi:MAG: hydantoinase/oxoprolinase family protein [Chloroflexota bacterium]